MVLAKNISEHIRQVFFGGNWTGVNLSTSIKDLDWKKATKPVGSFNSIAALVYHIHYYVAAQLRVLRGNPLDAHDRFSFDMPAIASEEDWLALKAHCFGDAGLLADAVAGLSNEMLQQDFTDSKYGTYYRNLWGMIEHTHYHLGQIVLLRKMLDEVPGG